MPLPGNPTSQTNNQIGSIGMPKPVPSELSSAGGGFLYLNIQNLKMVSNPNKEP